MTKLSVNRAASDAQLAVIPDASHFILYSEPEKLLPTIAAFLDAPTAIHRYRQDETRDEDD